MLSGHATDAVFHVGDAPLENADYVVAKNGETDYSGLECLGRPNQRLAFLKRPGCRRVYAPGLPTEIADQFTGSYDPKDDFPAVSRVLGNHCATLQQQECFLDRIGHDKKQLAVLKSFQPGAGQDCFSSETRDIGKELGSLQDLKSLSCVGHRQFSTGDRLRCLTSCCRLRPEITGMQCPPRLTIKQLHVVVTEQSKSGKHGN